MKSTEESIRVYYFRVSNCKQIEKNLYYYTYTYIRLKDRNFSMSEKADLDALWQNSGQTATKRNSHCDSFYNWPKNVLKMNKNAFWKLLGLRSKVKRTPIAVATISVKALLLYIYKIPLDIHKLYSVSHFLYGRKYFRWKLLKQ